MTDNSARIWAPADFGLAIQQARMEQGITQTDLAERADIAQSAVSAIENGKNTILLRTLIELMNELGIELTATWGSDDQTQS